MVAGDVVNTAARLQSNAPVNGILVGESTWRATRDAIDYRPAEPVQAKGKAEPVEAWEAVEARGRVGVDISSARADGARRPPPRARHAARRVRAGAERALGPARHPRRRAGDRQEPARLRALPGGRARPGARLLASGPLAALRRGRQLLGARGDGQGARRHPRDRRRGGGRAEAPRDRRGDRACRRRRVDDRAPPPAGGHRGHGRPERQPGRGVRRLAGLPRGDRRPGPARPRLRGSPLGGRRAARLRRPPRRLGDARAAARRRPPPGRSCSRGAPGWGGGKTNALTLSLAPLSGNETAELVHALLERAAIPADVQATLLERAGGNPLYAEEFVRLLDERADGAALPETVQGIIAARLDVLDREEKELLQDAAVLGRVFWVGGAGTRPREAEAALHRLERREFVQRERRSTVAGETEYAFRHALVREVAYEQIPRAQRGEKHRRVADWLETLGRSEDLAELLAHHYLAVLEYSEPDAELARAGRPRARRGGRPRAGAQRVPDRRGLLPPRARARCRRGRRGQLLFGLGSALSALADPEAAGHPRRGVRDAREPQATWRRLRRPSAFSPRSAFDTGDAPGVTRHVGRARRARARTPALRRARAGALAGRPVPDARRRAGAKPSSRAGRRSGWPRHSGSTRIRADALATVGTARGDLGDPRGDADLETAIELAEAANAPLPLSRALNNLAWRYTGIDLQRAHELSRAAVRDRSAATATSAQTWWARAQLVDTAFETGRWDEALEHAEAVIAYVEAGNPQYIEVQLPPRPRRHHVRTRRCRRVRRRDPPVARARRRGDRPPGERARLRLRRVSPPLGRRSRGRAAAARLGARDGAHERGRHRAHPLRGSARGSAPGARPGRARRYRPSRPPTHRDSAPPPRCSKAISSAQPTRSRSSGR